MNYMEQHPPRDLADYVLDFWQISTVDPEDVVPSQLYATDLLRIRFMNFQDRLQALLYGPSTSPHRKGLYLGDQVSFGATLMPTAARHIFGYDVKHFRDLRIDLGVLWPDENDELCQQIHHADFTQRVHALSDVLRLRLDALRVPHADFLNAYTLLSECQGDASIGELCRHVGVSQRTINRHFHAHVGMSPKECARTIRLHHRLNGFRQNGGAVDAVAGFADQSHWIREFKAMVGLSPNRYFSELNAIHQHQLSYWESTDIAHYAATPLPVVRFPDWRGRPNDAF